MKRSNEIRMKFSKLRKEEYRTGRHKPWNKGLTKENNKSLKIISEKNTGQKRTQEFCDNLSKIRTGKGNPFYKKQHTEETKRKLSDWRSKNLIGQNNPFYGCKHTVEWQKKQSERNKGKNNPMYGKKRPDFSDRYGKKDEFEREKFKKMNMRPTNIEKKFMNFCQQYNLPFIYVGNGDLIINGKNPDFIDENNKIIIEIYGDYWHKNENPQDRIKLFAEYNYSCIVIWECELKENNWEENIFKKLGY